MNIIFNTPVSNEIQQKFNALANTEILYTNRTIPDDETLEKADIILGNLAPHIIQKCTNLKWLQLDSAGANQYAALPGDFQLTNASGAYGEAIGEHMLACALTSLKNLPEYHELQQSHDWVNLGSVKTISQCKVLCIGTGDIGTSFAQKIHALGAKVDGLHRSSSPLPSCFENNYTTSQLNEILPNYDIIAMSLPESDETTNLIQEEQLRLMKKGSILINVGRGSAIDETALVKVAKEGHFKAVHLDVFVHEPLPKNNPLWIAPTVHVTPHISGRFNAEVTFDKVIDIFYTNLQHYLNGEPLEHVVDKTLGY